ncbi:MAG: hypothetical protein V7765_11140 [Oleispira sp.]
MTSISDDELGGHFGQALFRLDETNGVAQPDGTSLDFTKLTLGLKIEQNVTIDRVSAGRFYRPDGGTNAFGSEADASAACISSKICYYDQLNPWNCSSEKCGGFDDTLHVAALLYGTTFDDLTGFGTKEFSTFQSGFDPTNDRTNVDVILRDVTLGYVNDGTGELVDAVVENPYIELAYGNNNGIRSVEGFRFGFENQNGIMGNAIDVFSGFLVPHAVMKIVIQLGPIELPAADLNIDPWVGGVRTAAYIDPNKSVVNSCVGLACGFIGELAAGGDPSTPQGLSLASPEAQVFPLQSVGLVNAQGFFLTVQKKPVQWPDLPTGTPEVALPGVWINMGGGNSGLQVENTASWHPDNYFPGHPLDSVYLPSNNTNNGYY